MLSDCQLVIFIFMQDPQCPLEDSDDSGCRTEVGLSLIGVIHVGRS